MVDCSTDGLLRQLQLSVARAKMHELSRQLEAAEARLAEQEKLNVRSAVPETLNPNFYKPGTP